MNSSDELDTLELFQKLFPDIGFNQNKLDNPTNDIVVFVYQQFRNKLYVVLSDAVKDVEPDEGKRSDGDTVYSLVRFINFTTRYVYPNVDASMTFKLLHFPSGKSFKLHVRPLLKVLWNFELEFAKIKDILVQRFLDSKRLQAKRVELDNLKKKLAINVSGIATNEKKYVDLLKYREKVQHRFRKLTQQQDIEKLASEKLKEEVKSVVEKHDNLQVLVTNIKTNIQHLSKQIVTEDSYKALLSLTENVRVTCTELKNDESSVQENLRGKNCDIERFNTIEVHLDQLNTLVKELAYVQKQYSEKLLKRKDFYKIVQEITGKMQKLNSSTVQLKDKIKDRKNAIQNGRTKSLESTDRSDQELFEHNNCIVKEQENHEHQRSLKMNLEKTVSKLDKLCVAVKNQIDYVNGFHKHLYQKTINSENSIIENLCNTLSDMLNALKTAK